MPALILSVRPGANWKPNHSARRFRWCQRHDGTGGKFVQGVRDEGGVVAFDLDYACVVQGGDQPDRQAGAEAANNRGVPKGVERRPNSRGVPLALLDGCLARGLVGIGGIPIAAVLRDGNLAQLPLSVAHTLRCLPVAGGFAFARWGDTQRVERDRVRPAGPRQAHVGEALGRQRRR